MPILPIGSPRCQCRTCGEFFNSPSVFDEHRVRGTCLTVAEMTIRGWLVNAAGLWVSRLHGETRAEARTRGQNSRLPAGPHPYPYPTLGGLERRVS